MEGVVTHHCIRMKACYVGEGADVRLENSTVFFEDHLWKSEKLSDPRRIVR
jgi:hypothetical protein